MVTKDKKKEIEKSRGHNNKCLQTLSLSPYLIILKWDGEEELWWKKRGKRIERNEWKHNYKSSDSGINVEWDE